MKIDKRIHYYLVVDTETANTNRDNKGRLDTSSGLCYDIGWLICDRRGKVYRERSFVNRDVFLDYGELMKSAYYAEKIPQYLLDLQEGGRVLSNTTLIHGIMLEDMREFNVRAVIAHNAPFDIRVLNSTLRLVTCSNVRYWFPYGIPVWDTMRMGESVITKKKTYTQFVEKNDLWTPTGKLPKTAEAFYRFISGNSLFCESHTGLEDCLAEVKIFAYCVRQKKKMKREAFKAKEEIPAPTEFQIALRKNLKKIPVLKNFS